MIELRKTWKSRRASLKGAVADARKHNDGEGVSVVVLHLFYGFTSFKSHGFRV